MKTPDKKSKKLRKSRRIRETMEVSYEVSGACPERREAMVNAAFDLLFEATLRRMSPNISK